MASSPNDWLFDEEDLLYTPSRADGISYQEEMYQRAYGVDLIVRVGCIRITVPLLTIATASVLFHRFYMLESMKKYPAREVAITCLFLSSKIEESLRKVENVINTLLRLEERRLGKEPDVHPSDPKFKRLVQQVLFLEEIVLVTLQFDMTVQHPYPLVSKALKQQSDLLSHTESTSLGRCSWQMLTDMLVAACDLDGIQRLTLSNNHSYTTPFCICYEPPILAAASLLLAGTTLDILPALPDNWKDSFDIDWTDKDQVEDIDKVMARMLEVWQGARNPVFRAQSKELKQTPQRLPSAMKYLARKVEASTEQDQELASPPAALVMPTGQKIDQDLTTFPPAVDLNSEELGNLVTHSYSASTPSPVTPANDESDVQMDESQV